MFNIQNNIYDYHTDKALICHIASSCVEMIMLGRNFYCRDQQNLPSYSGSKPSRTAFAIFGFLPMMIVGIGDILRADSEGPERKGCIT
jgi:hypothetical protein